MLKRLRVKGSIPSPSERTGPDFFGRLEGGNTVVIEIADT